jgi:membrane-associated protein
VAIICTTSKIVLVQKKIFGSVKDFSKNTVVKPLFSLVFFQYFEHFCSIVAGIVSMDKQKFMFYNILSSFHIYTDFSQGIICMVLLENYQIDLKEHIELIVIALVITVLPAIYK